MRGYFSYSFSSLPVGGTKLANLNNNTMRVDAKKNLKKVATAILKDPLATQREIADRTGVGLGTVNDKLNKLEQSGEIDKTDAIIRIAKADLEHLEMIQGIELDHLSEYADKANKGEFFKPNDLHALESIADKKQKRYSILMGGNTDDKGGEKAIPILGGITNV